MKDKTFEAIVLKAIPYQSRKKIVTLFTKDHGLICLIFKNLSSKKPHLGLTTPLTHAQYHCRKTNGELYTFTDGTILSEHLYLRNDFDKLNSALLMCRALITSQLPEKPSPNLFALTLRYIQHLEHSAKPQLIIGSYLIKLLTHEGLLHITPQCSHCPSPSQGLIRGESYCPRCGGTSGTPFSTQEWETLLTLKEAKQFSKLEQQSITPILSAKINQIFEELLKM